MKRLLITTAILAGLAATATAKEGDWVVRARAISVTPDESATVTVLGGGVDSDTQIVPELDISYFFTDNIAAELIAATTNHNVTATAGGQDLGDVWLLPPTLTLQYHFVNDTAFKPYVGAGVNYTMFYGEESGRSITSIDYGDSFGPALQAGIDYKIDDKYILNLDVKKIWINTDVKINGGAIRADVDLNPWVVGAGIGYTF
jgi:outer membrane protein